MFRWNFLCFSLCSLLLDLALSTTESGSVFLTPSNHILMLRSHIPSHLSLYDKHFNSFICFWTPRWTPSSLSAFFLCWGAHAWTQHCTSVTPMLLAMLCLTQPRCHWPSLPYGHTASSFSTCLLGYPGASLKSCFPPNFPLCCNLVITLVKAELFTFSSASLRSDKSDKSFFIAGMVYIHILYNRFC